MGQAGFVCIKTLLDLSVPDWTHSPPNSGLLLWTGLPPEMVGCEPDSCQVFPAARGRGRFQPLPHLPSLLPCVLDPVLTSLDFPGTRVLGVVGLSVKVMLDWRRVGAERAPQWSGPVSGGLCGRNPAGLSSLDFCLALSCPMLLHFPPVTLQFYLPQVWAERL